MSRFNKTTKILAVTAGVLLIMVVGLSVQTAGFGVELTQLERQRVGMTKDKTYLEEQIAKSISLRSAENLARKYRFSKNYEIVYLNNFDNFAQANGH